MTGGISAIKGFDYQATVILSRLFDHFDQYGAAAEVRPEGIDDLDLCWIADGMEHRRYEQIKKPREDDNGNLKLTSWTLSAVIEELMPNTIRHLSENNFTQIWILGDHVEDEVSSLIAAGKYAPSAASQTYWNSLHRLTRNDLMNSLSIESPLRNKLRRWKIPSDISANPEEALSRIVTEFTEFAANFGGINLKNRYRVSAEHLHGKFPNILARTSILSNYGTEQEVANCVYDRLQKQFSLQRSVVENTLFRNLLGFVNFISKEKTRKFNKSEFEFELRCIWPLMIPIRDAPPLTQEHIKRPDLTAQFTSNWTGNIIEANGISGSGKTMLAAEVIEHLQTIDPSRLVYYAEVRPDNRLRDVLTGVAFYLRRLNFSEPFSIAVENNVTEEEILTRLARAYSSLPQNVTLLVDLVEGASSHGFTHDLSIFIRALPRSSFQFAILGQESSLGELNEVEKDEYGIKRFDIRGFSFEEFTKLVTVYHQNPDHYLLDEIYQRVTAGRAAGLFAKLAQSLARASSLQEMSEMSKRPADDILGFAEQRRFARISESARPAAEKLVCFALPFRRKDAEDVFKDDNIGAAIREMLSQGLLRRHDGEAFEMHETVRAGLEGTIAVSARRSAHQMLATWYGAHGLNTAQILHLEKAGMLVEAHEHARRSLLRGEHWAALSAYVIEHRLASASEVIAAIASTNPVEDQYLLSRILRELDGPVVVEDLFQLFQDQPKRFYDDFKWASAIAEAILEFDPSKLDDLIIFSIDMETDFSKIESAVNWIFLAARRKNAEIGASIIKIFVRQTTEIKRLLLQLMLLSHRRDAMSFAFQFIISDQGDISPKQRKRASRHEFSLHIRNYEDTIEFLAAIPDVQVTTMLVTKSVSLGPLATIIWSHRSILREHCINVLRANLNEGNVIKNAIRVLVFLAEPSICMLCEPYMKGEKGIREFAALVPILVPAFCDRSRYENLLLSRSVPLEDRVTALFVLASLGADLGAMYRCLSADEADPREMQAWNHWFLTLCDQAPFADAIPLLDAYIQSSDPNVVPLIVSALKKLGGLPTIAATQMLIRALDHVNPRVRQCAAAMLNQRRSHAALPSLIGKYENETDEANAVGLATAILASGPVSVAHLNGRFDSTTIQLWQCILSMRLRDVSNADRLVSIALEPTLNWQLRRAAIFAAGRLPYEFALERIAPAVLSEQSPLSIDKSLSLRCHSVMTSILLSGAQGLMSIFGRGRDYFVDFFGDVFEASQKDAMFPEDLPTPSESAAWLFDRLLYHGWPTKPEAPDLVLNELSIPMLHSAILRSFRFCARPDLIEEQIPVANHVWLAMKCLSERLRAGSWDSDLRSRLKNLLEASPYRENARLHRVIAEISDRPPSSGPSKAIASVDREVPTRALIISYSDAVRVLTIANSGFKIEPPIVLETPTVPELERLIVLADPANEVHRRTEIYVPLVQFNRNGYTVARRQTTYTGELASVFLRAAIAAANKFHLPIPWHSELLNGALATTYVPKYLDSLGALDDSRRFYEEFSENEEVLISYICKSTHASPILKYIDDRIVPTIARYMFSGTDEFFEGLCTLALKVNGPEIDPILSSLLYRWSQRFDSRSAVLQHENNHVLWHAFHRLSEHPRFNLIEGGYNRLAAILQTPMNWYHAQNIVRVLERDPRSYILIESRLFKTVNWEHMHQDEIDRLDAASETLFNKLLEP